MSAEDIALIILVSTIPITAIGVLVAIIIAEWRS